MKTFSKKPGSEVMRIISCGVCGSISFKQHWDCGDFRFQRCDGCGVILQNPQPDPNQLLERYDEEYSEYEIENAQGYLGLMRMGMEDMGFSAWKDQWKAKGAFLDIGCATGALVKELSLDGWDAKGVEPCAPAARYGIAHRGVDIHLGTLDNAPYPAESFSLIHFSHVIEHVTEPQVFLNQVARLLKPGGRILLTTPNTTSFQAQWFGSEWRSAIADHMYLLDKSQLTLLLKKAGLLPLKWKTWGAWPSAQDRNGSKESLTPSPRPGALGM
jgi:2-polyprenyl-3-methyl-5-hydroxy-6-metoxy-1,4-benzoquinol methylase